MFQGDPKPFKRFIAFCVSSSVLLVLKKNKGYILDSEVTPARSKKKDT